MENGNGKSKQYVVQPLQFNADIQLGPDGHPWVRWQFATPGMSCTLVFPHESAEDVINNITTGTREQVKRATKKMVEIVPPDFTDIKVQHKL